MGPSAEWQVFCYWRVHCPPIFPVKMINLFGKKEGKELTEDCSDHIGQLEEAPLLYNEIPALVEEKVERLRNIKIRVWGLFSLARLVTLGNQLSTLPGCEAFGKLGWAVDTVLKAFHGAPSEEEFNGLRNLSSAFYELGDIPGLTTKGTRYFTSAHF